MLIRSRPVLSQKRSRKLIIPALEFKMDTENGHSYDDNSDTEYITVKDEVISDNEIDRCEEVEEEENQTGKLEDKEISTEPTQNFRRNDLFQQPFVLKYLQDHLKYLEQTVQDSSNIGEEHECFVDPKCICRLCTKSDQNIFMRLFFKNHTLTPIAEKLVYLTGREYVEEDLLPQQICLECCQSIKSSYTAVTGFLDTYQILSDVVSEIKKKTHVFHKPNTTLSMYMEVYDKDYEFYQKRRSTDQEKKNNARKKENAESLNPSVKCYLCKENFLTGSLKEHMAVKHDCNIEYKCTSCDNAFSTLPELSTHQCPADSDEILEHDASKELNNFNYSDGEISGTSEHEFTPDMMAYPTSSNKKRKRLILERHCHEMVKKGPTECKSCKYCGRVFQLKFSDDLIKAHILTHLYSSEEKQLTEIDPNNLDLMDHLTLKPCYICSFCSMTKETATALRTHVNQFCTTFSRKFGFKVRDRKRYGKTRGRLQLCKVCVDDKAYKRKDFVIHMKENHPELVFFCRFCPKFFLSRSEIDYHNRMRHINQKCPVIKDGNVEIKKETLLCEFCSRECKTQRGYQAHVFRAHLNSKPKNPKKELKRLAKKHKVNDATFLECPICSCKRSFKDGQAGLEFHIMKHNAPNGKIVCCNREYINFVKYRIHISSHSRTWSCRLCSLVCGSAVLLRDHVARSHAQSTVCTECSHVSKSISQHTKHMQQFHGLNKMCSECNMIFSTQKELMIHNRQFHWEKLSADQVEKSDLPEPVLCCGKKFTKRANLKSHTAKHQDTVCKTCGDVLKSKLALLGHNATHHRQGVECSYCSKSFCNNDSLKYHMLKHTQGRQFKCACGLSFYTEADRNKHLRHRKKPCLGSIMEDNATVVVVNDENMDWTEDNLE